MSIGIINTVVDGRLPLDEGDRVISIRNVQDGDERPGRPTHLHDLVTWREELRAVTRRVRERSIRPRSRYT